MFFKKDYYKFLSKKYNLRSRAWFKLYEIDKKFKLINKNNIILEIGCAPGSWSEYISNITKVVSIDIIDMKSVNSCFYINANLIKKNIFLKFHQIFCKIRFDIILSDACYNTSGINTIDLNHTNKIIHLNKKLLIYLKYKSNLVTKLFNFNKLNYYLDHIKNNFINFTFYKPKSSKANSKEIFCIFTQKK